MIGIHNLISAEKIQFYALYQGMHYFKQIHISVCYFLFFLPFIMEFNLNKNVHARIQGALAITLENNQCKRARYPFWRAL